MNQKILLLLNIVSISISGLLALVDRPPREYSEPMPSSIMDRISPNRTAIRNISAVEPKRIPSEPLGCSKCLDDKYLVHYYQRGCKPIRGHLLCLKPCPQYFECPEKKVVQGCEYRGKVYNIGEKVPVDNPCKRGCFCSDAFSDPTKNISRPGIECAHVDCFNNLKAKSPNCYDTYVPDQCCPKEICLNQTQTQIKCAFNGKEYRLGQIIHQNIDPCVQCTCDEQWEQNKGLNNTKCKTIVCDLEANRKFRDGCLPIYHEKTCCPIDYYCPPPEEHYCKFGDRKYMIGETLDIDYARTQCKCIVPPDFTCIQKTYEEFAPKVLLKTLPKVDVKNKTEDNLPFITTSVPKVRCPPYVEGGLACAGVNCTTIIGSDGCQTCKCEQPCPVLDCNYNCILVATTPGVCPQCKCD